MEKSNFGDRMKKYENAFRICLPIRMPLIIRLDGCAFHTYTAKFEKPFDARLISAMQETCIYLCKEIMGCKLAYWQSDEISLLLTDYNQLNSQAWFDKNIQKITSVSASMATAIFNREMFARGVVKLAHFDSRVVILPPDEVCNYFLWRQRDAERNSLQSLAQQHFSQKQLHGLKTSQLHDLLMLDKGINWNDIPTYQKRGACVIYKEGKWEMDEEIPVFSQDRSYIEKHVYLETKD